MFNTEAERGNPPQSDTIADVVADTVADAFADVVADTIADAFADTVGDTIADGYVDDGVYFRNGQVETEETENGNGKLKWKTEAES